VVHEGRRGSREGERVEPQEGRGLAKSHVVYWKSFAFSQKRGISVINTYFLMFARNILLLFQA